MRITVLPPWPQHNAHACVPSIVSVGWRKAPFFFFRFCVCLLLLMPSSSTELNEAILARHKPVLVNSLHGFDGFRGQAQHYLGLARSQRGD